MKNIHILFCFNGKGAIQAAFPLSTTICAFSDGHSGAKLTKHILSTKSTQRGDSRFNVIYDYIKTI